MRKIDVPSPPQPSFETKRGTATRQSNVAASQRIAPLDAAFLGRVYRAVIWFTVPLVLCAATVSKAWDWPLSVLAGVLTSLLVLKTQEMFVRRVVRPKTMGAYEGADRKIPAWMIVPGKYLVIIAAILLMRRFGLLNFGGFAIGCTAVQLILMTMALGRLQLNRRAGKRGLSDSLNEVYVRPHMKH